MSFCSLTASQPVPLPPWGKEGAPRTTCQQEESNISLYYIGLLKTKNKNWLLRCSELNLSPAQVKGRFAFDFIRIGVLHLLRSYPYGSSSYWPFSQCPVLTQGKVSPAPGSSQSKTRNSRAVPEGFGEESDQTVLVRIDGMLWGMLFIRQHQGYRRQRKALWKQLKGRWQDSSEVWRTSLPNMQGEFILQGIIY